MNNCLMIGMWEFRVFWFMRLDFVRVVYVDDDGNEHGQGGQNVLYLGPFVICKHWLPDESEES